MLYMCTIDNLYEMKVKKIRNAVLLILSVLFAFFASGCGGDTEKKTDAADSGTPPSVSAEQNKAVIEYVKLDDKQVKELAVKTVTLRKETVNYEITAPGTVYPAPENVYVVSAPLSGRVVTIYAHEGEYVKKGQLLLEIESLEYASLVSEYMQAKADETYFKSNFDRITLLVQQKISSQSDLDKAKADYQRALAAVRSANARLAAVGISQKEIDDFSKGINTADPHLKIYSMITGQINEHLIDMGQSVEALQKMLTIVNLDRVLVKGYISPEEGNYVRQGDAVCISQKEMADKICNSVITSLNPALDERNKSVVANILVATVNGFPKPGLNVRLSITSKTGVPAITVPLSAVVYEGDNPVVFVKTDERTYEKRIIKGTKLTGDKLVVESGLQENEEVAVTQLFSLKALNRFEKYSAE